MDAVAVAAEKAAGITDLASEARVVGVVGDGGAHRLPDPLLGIEVGCVGRQEDELDLGMGWQPVVANGPGVVEADVVEQDNEVLAWVRQDELVQEALKRLGVAGWGTGAQLFSSAEVDGAEERDPPSCPGVGRNLGLSTPLTPLTRHRCLRLQGRLVLSQHHEIGIGLELSPDFFSPRPGRSRPLQAWHRGTASSVAGG